jgi:hypothetical protein
MAIGSSGRVVIELDPEMKKRIHDAVRGRGLTLRDWFLQQVEKDLLEANGSQRGKLAPKPPKSAR